MPAEIKKEIQFEIGHVLFIDIVGYSKLLINEQSEQMQKLREIIANAVHINVQLITRSDCTDCPRASEPRPQGSSVEGTQRCTE